MGDDFKKGIEERRLDITFEPNPLPALCIIKTIEYYMEKGFKIGERLIQFIERKEKHLSADDLTNIQYRHYGEIKYSPDDIRKYIKLLVGRKEHRRKLRANVERTKQYRQRELFSYL